MSKQKQIDRVFDILVQYELAKSPDSPETEEGYKSYLYRLYVQYYGKQDEEIYQTIRGLHELGLAIPHDKLRSIVFHLIHNIKQ